MYEEETYDILKRNGLGLKFFNMKHHPFPAAARWEGLEIINPLLLQLHLLPQVYKFLHHRTGELA